MNDGVHLRSLDISKGKGIFNFYPDIAFDDKKNTFNR